MHTGVSLTMDSAAWKQNTGGYYSTIVKIGTAIVHWVIPRQITQVFRKCHLTVSQMFPKKVLCLKSYNLPFFGWRYGNVDNYLLTVCFLHVILCVLSQYVQNYRPTYEQTNILLDQLENTFLVISHAQGGYY